jgi:hypothetical protein
VAFTGQATYSIPLCKVAPGKGVTFVYGKASDGRLDRDDQIVDESWALGALKSWLAGGGPVRMAHDGRRPVGKGVEVNGLFVKSAIYVKEARRLLRHSVLTSYSVGIGSPVIRPDPRAARGRIVGGEILELSIVDSPSNVGCGITLVKSAPDGRAVFVGRPFVTKGGAVGVCLSCGEGLKSRWKHCPRCGAKSALYNPKEDPAVKKRQKRALKALAAQDRVRALTKAAGSPYPVYTEAEAVRAMLIRDLDNPHGATREAAADALRRLRA